MINKLFAKSLLIKSTNLLLIKDKLLASKLKLYKCQLLIRMISKMSNHHKIDSSQNKIITLLHKQNHSFNFQSIMLEIKSTFNGTKKVDRCHKVIIKEIPVNHQIQEPMQTDQECKSQLLVSKDKDMIFSKTFKLTVVINLFKLKFIRNSTSSWRKNIENKHKLQKINLINVFNFKIAKILWNWKLWSIN